MSDTLGFNGDHQEVVNLDPQGVTADSHSSSTTTPSSSSCTHLVRKLIAELLGTYFLIFAGCAAEVVNTSYDKVVTHPGIAIVWGLTVMVLVYSNLHISGAHFNPAITTAFATGKKFPWKQVPFYIPVQVTGSTLAAGTLRLLFSDKQKVLTVTEPTGLDIQSFVVEFLITFYLMYVRFGIATDKRAVRELAALNSGATVLLNVLFAGPISGASMNPARSLGPAIVWNHYKSIWIYLTAPILGAASGAVIYRVISRTYKPLHEASNIGSFPRVPLDVF